MPGTDPSPEGGGSGGEVGSRECTHIMVLSAYVSHHKHCHLSPIHAGAVEVLVMIPV